MTKKNPDSRRKTLRETTIDLLRHRDRTQTYDVISAATGLSPAFLSSLLSPDPPQHPSVDSIQRLYEFLTGTPLNY